MQQARGKPRALDGKDLFAAAVAGRLIGWHKGPLFDGAHETDTNRNLIGRIVHHLPRLFRLGRAQCERFVLAALKLEKGKVHICKQNIGFAFETLVLCQHAPVLSDHRVAAENQVGARLSRPRPGIHVGRQAARRLLQHQIAPILAFPNKLIARREIAKNRRATQSLPRAGRNGTPPVLADLDPHREIRNAKRLEDEVGSKGNFLVTDANGFGLRADRRRKPALLVKFARVGQVRLRYDAQDIALPTNHCAVEEHSVEPDWKP